MEWLSQLILGESVAHSVLVLSLVTAFGLALGSVRIFGVSLGIAGVLFSGLFLGHFGISVDPHVMEFVREFGLILFVYTVGMQVGPGFLSSFRRQGLPLNIMAASVVLLGVLTALGVHYFGKVELPVVAGLLSGGTTNTPSLAAAQQALKEIPDLAEQTAKLPGLGYAIAYPFGILGIILTMLLVRLVFRVNLKKEQEAYSRHEGEKPVLTTLNLKVTNANLDGLPVRSVPRIGELRVVVSRILHDGVLSVAKRDTVIHEGDILLTVGTRENLREFRLIVGVESDTDLKELPSSITTKRILVTRKNTVGKTLDELELQQRFGVTITRVSRAEVDFTPAPGFRFQYGDTILAVGQEQDIQKAAEELGNSLKHLNHPHIIPIFVGIALGVLIGSWPIHLSGIPVPVRLGLAGGPLFVAILLSNIGRIGPLIWYMPISANFMLRELGVCLFLACVGLKSGDQFLQTLVQGQGLYWMAMAAVITLLPLLIVGFIARVFYKLNYMALCGLLAGSMTDPPALAFAGAVTGSDAPSVAYATVYPLTMLLRVISIQILVLFFMR